MRIGIYANPEKDSQYRTACHAAALIRKAGSEAVADHHHQNTPLEDAVDALVMDYSDCDAMLSFGGDGTFLSVVHLPGMKDVPMAGVNLGSVGFLPEIQPQAIEAAISKLLSGQYRLETRMMLEVSSFDAQGQLLDQRDALNDAVISRGGMAPILMLDLWINEEKVEQIPGDGLIVSAPTGSTAYSLSAGGPIVHPDLDLLLMTPICPHTLHNRSYIAPAESTVRVHVGTCPHPAVLSIDGRKEIRLASDCHVKIKKSKRYLNMIRFGDDRFYATLPRKIEARGKGM